MVPLTTIELGGGVEPWLALGLGLEPGADRPTIPVGMVRCRFDPAAPEGIGALGVDGPGHDVELDGLRFVHAPAGDPADPSLHACRASLVDHVVVMTSSLDRTCGAVADGLGAPLRRIRDVAPGVRQGFHRLGEVILEVVETPQVTAETAAFWGLVFVVPDLDGWAERMGPDACSPAKTAVQPGRRISNVRREAGLGCPVAFMSPDPRHG